MDREKINKIKQLIEKWDNLESFIELLKKEETEIYIIGRNKYQFPTTSARVLLEDKEIVKEILRKKEIELENIGNEIEKLIKNEPTKIKIGTGLYVDVFEDLKSIIIQRGRHAGINNLNKKIEEIREHIEEEYGKQK